MVPSIRLSDGHAGARGGVLSLLSTSLCQNAAHRPLTERKGVRPEQVFEKIQASFQGVYGTGAGMQMMRIDPAAQIFNALATLGQQFLARMQRESEAVMQIRGYGVRQPESVAASGPNRSKSSM